MQDVNTGSNEVRKRDLDELFGRLYLKLRSLASRVSWNSSNPTLNPTALVHEAYLKLLKDPPDLSSKSYEETIALFANAMRQILIDAARRRMAQKREAVSAPEGADLLVEDVLTLKGVLEDLERDHPRQSRIVDCRFYLGMTVNETATALNLSEATVEREWREAKARLGSKISTSAGAGA